MIGQVISHYKILEKLGEGGMGVVYKAEDTSLQRTVALKFLPCEYNIEPRACERFFREAQTAGALDHPNICTIHEVGQTEDGRCFICMTFYDGQTLKTKIEHGPCTVQEAIRITLQIARGLQKAHEAGITHQDIKSANVMITNDGTVKILDFGLAKLGNQLSSTRMGVIVGTPAYMSPEQVRGEPVTHHSDIWALGVCLFEMLTGKLPFSGDYWPALMYAILNDNPPSFTDLKLGVPISGTGTEVHGLESIVKRCLEKRPEDRYRTMTELITDLERFQSTHGEGSYVRDRSAAGGRRMVRKVVGLSALIVAVGIVILELLTPVSRESTEKRKSIAILPFKNLDDVKADEYFSDGITEDVINHLSRIGDITVVSRTSVMQYKNTQKTIPEIARELQVGAVLEGSIRRSGDRVRIVSQLVDARSDRSLWSETYDRKITDILVIQSDIAWNIAQALRVTLRLEGTEVNRGRPAGNITAYEYCLKGREYYYRFREEDNEQAINLFRKAIGLEPNNAVAWAGLADACAQGVAKFGYTSNWIDSAVDAGIHAISLDADVPEAHKALGLAYSGKGWHRKAVASYLKALDLNPNYLTAATNLGAEYSFMGKLDTSLFWDKRSLPLNPTFPFSYLNIGGVYESMGNDSTANEWFQKCLELQPDFPYIHAGFSLMYLRQGDYQRSLSEALRILSANPNDLEGLTLAGWSELYAGKYVQANVYFEKAISIDSIGKFWYGCGRSSYTAIGFTGLKLGQHEQARRMLQRSRKFDESQMEDQSEWYMIRYDLALISALEGKREEAYQWLQRAIALGWRDYRLGMRDPLLENLRADAEFRRMMTEVHTTVDEMRRRAESTEKF